MRAGKMDRTIIIQRGTEEVDDFGTVTNTVATIATLRAQVIQQSNEEFLRAFGASSDRIVIFRTRWLAGLTNEDRVMFEGVMFDIKELREIGRRRGLDFRCVARDA